MILMQARIHPEKVTTAIKYDTAQQLYKVPYSNVPYNYTTTSQLLWSEIFGNNEAVRKTGVAVIGLYTSVYPFLLGYAVRKGDEANKYSFFYNTHAAGATGVFSLFNCNQQSGKVALNVAPYYTKPSVDATKRPYIVNATKYMNQTTWTIYNSIIVNASAISCAKAITSVVDDLSKTFVGFTEIPLSFFDEYLVKISGSTRVTYIMNQYNILMASSVGLALNLTQNALVSPDQHIKDSSTYIVSNKITVDTNRFASSLGYTIQVKFFKTPDPGITWTLVSTVTADQSDEYVTNSQSNESTLSDIQIMVEAVIAVTVISLISLFALMYKAFENQRTPPMSTSSSLPSDKL